MKILPFSNYDLKTPVKTLKISCEESILNAIEESIKDFKAALFIEDLKMSLQENNYKIELIELDK